MRTLIFILLSTSLQGQSPARAILNNGAIMTTIGIGAYAMFGNEKGSRYAPPRYATMAFMVSGTTAFLLNADTYTDRHPTMSVKKIDLNLPKLKEMVPSMLFSFGAGVMRGYNHVTLSRADVFLRYHRLDPEWVDFTKSWDNKDSWFPGTFGDDMFHMTAQLETWGSSFSGAFIPVKGARIWKALALTTTHWIGQNTIMWIYRR